MKRKQMQLADSRLVLSSGAKLAHCHGKPVGRLILRPRCKLWITCAMLDAPLVLEKILIALTATTGEIAGC